MSSEKKRKLQTCDEVACRKGGGEPKKRKRSVAVAKTMNITQAEDEITFADRQSEERPPARCLSDSDGKPSYRKCGTSFEYLASRNVFVQ